PPGGRVVPACRRGAARRRLGSLRRRAVPAGGRVAPAAGRPRRPRALVVNRRHGVGSMKTLRLQQLRLSTSWILLPRTTRYSRAPTPVTRAYSRTPHCPVPAHRG